MEQPLKERSLTDRLPRAKEHGGGIRESKDPAVNYCCLLSCRTGGTRGMETYVTSPSGDSAPHRLIKIVTDRRFIPRLLFATA